MKILLATVGKDFSLDIGLSHRKEINTDYHKDV
ncbi:hypothetical protein V528_01965 [Streptococcus thermophilus TH1436]|nr:hypothetical protein V528_01965 [Streptococcus thermophilus TH1436]CCC19231.1 hypothetical protein STH8232_0499 [Streptococcus thermophilus JIM 8232]SSC63172.1 Uncharacterized protein STN4L_01220 [Streptococcus thermophilus]